MNPNFQVIADQKDITELLHDRLLAIKITDKPGLESDECEIRIDDRDGMVAFPKKGATLEISLGYEGEKLVFVGRYRVDDITISGPPATIVIRGKPANIAATLKSQKRWAWEGVKLADIVGDIARRNKLQPMCQVDASVPRADQINESDMHFITRLARAHGATATVKDGKLIVARRGAGKSGSGKPIPALVLHRDDLATYSVTFPDRALFSGVQANYHDGKTGKLETVHLPNPDAPAGVQAPTHTERHVHPNKAAATAAAESRQAALNRATADGRLELTRGRADVCSEQWLQLNGIKDKVDGVYVIDTVEQEYSNRAWVTHLTINAGNGGKGKVGRDKKAAPATKVLNLGAADS